jgi:hypothetical protein
LLDSEAYANVRQLISDEGKELRSGKYEVSSTTLRLRTGSSVSYILGQNWWAVEAVKSIATAYADYTRDDPPPQIPPIAAEQARPVAQQQTTIPSAPPPDWFIDPNNPSILRWWDGQQFTHFTKPLLA